jgi:hypothetical protein
MLDQQPLAAFDRDPQSAVFPQDAAEFGEPAHVVVEASLQ